MSFAAETKKELTQINARSCCNRAELSALIRMSGHLNRPDEHLTLDVTTENAAIARRIYSLIKETYGIQPEVLVQKKMKLKKNNVYMVRLPWLEEVRQMMADLGLIHDGQKELGFAPTMDPAVVGQKCCRRAYLRGAFLAGGSVNSPASHSYHLEISCGSELLCHELCTLANFFDVNAKCIERKKGYVLYVKEGEKITSFLSVIGAYQALLRFEDVRIVKDMRNSVNRLVNCDTANLNKTIQASMKQLDNIRLIDTKLGLENLPVKLKEVAEARVRHPDMSLSELGHHLPGGYVSKSGVNHRLRKLDEIAERLKRQA